MSLHRVLVGEEHRFIEGQHRRCFVIHVAHKGIYRLATGLPLCATNFPAGPHSGFRPLADPVALLSAVAPALPPFHSLMHVRNVPAGVAQVCGHLHAALLAESALKVGNHSGAARDGCQKSLYAWQRPIQHLCGTDQAINQDCHRWHFWMWRRCRQWSQAIRHDS